MVRLQMLANTFRPSPARSAHVQRMGRAGPPDGETLRETQSHGEEGGPQEEESQANRQWDDRSAAIAPRLRIQLETRHQALLRRSRENSLLDSKVSLSTTSIPLTPPLTKRFQPGPPSSTAKIIRSNISNYNLVPTQTSKLPRYSCIQT